MQGDKQICFNGSKVLIFKKSLQTHTQLLLQSLWESAVWLCVITRIMELMSSNTLHVFYSFTRKHASKTAYSAVLSVW
jgi:hypothetical protein